MENSIPLKIRFLYPLGNYLVKLNIKNIRLCWICHCITLEFLLLNLDKWSLDNSFMLHVHLIKNEFTMQYNNQKIFILKPRLC